MVSACRPIYFTYELLGTQLSTMGKCVTAPGEAGPRGPEAGVWQTLLRWMTHHGHGLLSAPLSLGESN